MEEKSLGSIYIAGSCQARGTQLDPVPQIPKRPCFPPWQPNQMTGECCNNFILSFVVKPKLEPLFAMYFCANFAFQIWQMYQFQ